MNIPIELIKYGLLLIIAIVAGFKTFQITKKIIKKIKDKDEDDFDLSLKDI